MHGKNYQAKYGKRCVKNASHLPNVSPLFRDAITIVCIFFDECFTAFRLYLRALRAVSWKIYDNVLPFLWIYENYIDTCSNGFIALIQVDLSAFIVYQLLELIAWIISDY